MIIFSMVSHRTSFLQFCFTDTNPLITCKAVPRTPLTFIIPLATMKLNLALVVAVLPFLTGANPVANAEADLATDSKPVALPRAIPESLDKRADKTCHVDTSDGPVNCRKGAGTGYAVVRQIYAGENFGVRCKADGQTIYGNK